MLRVLYGRTSMQCMSVLNALDLFRVYCIAVGRNGAEVIGDKPTQLCILIQISNLINQSISLLRNGSQVAK